MLCTIQWSDHIVWFILIGILVGVVAALAVLVARAAAKAAREKRVKEESSALIALRALNDETDFSLEEFRSAGDEALAEEIENYTPCYFTIYKKVRTGEALARFDFARAMQHEVSENPDYYRNIMAGVYENRALMEEYAQKAAAITRPGPGMEWEGFKMTQAEYEAIENEAWDEIYATPITDPVFRFYLSAAEVGRTDLGRRSVKFTFAEIEEMILHAEEANEENADNPIPAALRMEILKRDRFRCRECHRAEKDGVMLAVEYLTPPEEGGVTEPDNLITLCWDCFRNKKTGCPT